MAVAHQNISVTTSPVSITAGTTDSHHSAGVDRSVIIQNSSIGTIYLGGAGVTTTIYGYAIPAAGELALDLKTDDVLYAVASAPYTVHVLYLGG